MLATISGYLERLGQAAAEQSRYDSHLWTVVVNSIETAQHNRMHGFIIPTRAPNPRQLVAASNLALTVVEKAVERFIALSHPAT